MSRVLLFTQTGDARPKCVRAFAPGNEYQRNPARFASHLETFSHIKPMPYRDLRLAYDADRWWLVECANAEAGRGVIAWTRTGGPDPIINEPCPFGRILASGGRREA